MKKNLFTNLFVIICTPIFSQGVSINETGAAPHESAILDVSSSNKGFLPPRMTTAQRDAIVNPSKSLIIFNTDLNMLQYNKGTNTNPNWVILNTNDTTSTETKDLGYVVGWAGNSTIPSNLLPLSGGTYSWADYPELFELHNNSNLTFVSASNSTNFTLININDERMIRGNQSSGSIGGSNQISINQNQLPNATLSYSRITSFSTSGSAGAGSGSFLSEGSTPVLIGWSGNGRITFNSSLVPTSSLNGGVTQQMLDLSPQYFDVIWCVKSRSSLPVNVEGIAIIGDVKTGFQLSDHNGWIKLDGRSINSLNSAQQTKCIELGFLDFLPDASNSVLMQDNNPVGSVNGTNSRIISQDNLPNIQLDYSRFTSFSTSGSAGSSSGTFNPNGSTPVLIGWDGNGRITFNSSATQKTSSLNGGVSQQELDISPKRLSVNSFVYLGN